MIQLYVYNVYNTIKRIEYSVQNREMFESTTVRFLHFAHISYAQTRESRCRASILERVACADAQRIVEKLVATHRDTNLN